MKNQDTSCTSKLALLTKKKKMKYKILSLLTEHMVD